MNQPRFQIGQWVWVETQPGYQRWGRVVGYEDGKQLRARVDGWIYYIRIDGVDGSIERIMVAEQQLTECDGLITGCQEKPNE